MTTWRTTWETDLTDVDHAALAAVLARAFPETDLRGRSWCSERPELRLVGLDDEGAPVAHLAILRRFVRVGREQVLVADTGLVAVDPDRQDRGLGRALLAQAADLIADLGVAFGFLTTGHDREGFYTRGGWRRTPTQLTRTIERDDSLQVWREASLHLPLGRGTFPDGEITRDGYEV